MNSPQTELGFIQIATGAPENDILSALIRAQLTGAEYQVVLSILRQTWGYEGKKSDWISVSQFVKFTGRSKNGVLNAVASLEERKIITADRTSGQRTLYRFEKSFHAWIVPPTRPVHKSRPVHCSGPTGPLYCTTPVHSTAHTKETLTKETIQKKTSPAEKGPRPSVESVMNAMRENFGTLDDTEKMNRRYAWSLIQRAMKFGTGSTEDDAARACVSLINAAAKHEWWGPRIKSVQTIFRKSQAIVAALRADQKKHTVVHI